jgi:putative endonuclease
MDREKEIKGWTRIKKLALIKIDNPKQRFLNNEIMEWPPNDPIHR